jgi:hypothetical protein
MHVSGYGHLRGGTRAPVTKLCGSCSSRARYKAAERRLWGRTGFGRQFGRQSRGATFTCCSFASPPLSKNPEPKALLGRIDGGHVGCWLWPPWPLLRPSSGLAPDEFADQSRSLLPRGDTTWQEGRLRTRQALLRHSRQRGPAEGDPPRLSTRIPRGVRLAGSNDLRFAVVHSRRRASTS